CRPWWSPSHGLGCGRGERPKRAEESSGRWSRVLALPAPAGSHLAAVGAQVAQNAVLQLLGRVEELDLALEAVLERADVLGAVALQVADDLGVRLDLDGREALQRHGRGQAPQDRGGARVDRADAARAAAARAGMEHLLAHARAEALAR